MDEMKYFLVSKQDNDKISIPNGETVIGRGPFLKVRDKRVSRSHAVISLEDGDLQIKPNHDNPIFFCDGAGHEFSPLMKGKWKNLCHGDSISLLPNSLIFTVLSNQKSSKTKKESEVDAREKEIHGTSQQNAKENCSLENDDKDFKADLEKEDSATINKPTMESTFEDSIDSIDDREVGKGITDAEENDMQNLADDNCEVSMSNEGAKYEKSTEVSSVCATQGGSEKVRVLPSWMTSNISPIKNSPNSKKRKFQREDGKTEKPVVNKRKVTSDELDDKYQTADFTSPENVSKTGNEEDLPAEKKNQEMQTSSMVTSGQTDSAKTAAKLNDESTTAEENKVILSSDLSNSQESNDNREKQENVEAKKKLPKCVYGKSCYRKNPVHLEEYSHSDHDSDDGIDDKPECPYGTSCYRKNLQHKTEYKHTQSPVKERRTRKSTRSTKRKSILTGDSDDDGENTYDYNDSFIDDETDFESESSYNDDEEEDPDFEAEEDEDLDQLKAEADEF